MSWGIVAGAAVSLVGSYMGNQSQKSAAKKASSAQTAASQAAIDEQRRQYDQSRQDMLPFMQAGYGALDKQNAILNGDYSGFMNSPDYQFALDQGTKFMDRSAASRGGLYSAGHSADMMKYGQGLASQNLNNYWSKLAGQANQSYNAGSFMGQYGQSMASGIGNNLNNAANARASSYLTAGNGNSAMWGQAGNAIGGALGNYLGNRGGYNYGGGASYAPYSTSTTGDYQFGAGGWTGSQAAPYGGSTPFSGSSW